MKRRFLFLLMAVCSFVGANAALNRANNNLTLGSATGEQGKTVEVTLNMKNATKAIINWQAELVLPQGVTLVSVAQTGRWTEAIQVNGNTLFSETETAVAKGESTATPIATITLKVDASVAEGEYTIELKNTVMHADDGTEISQPATETVSAKLTVTPAIGIRGDLDGSGTVGVGDIEEILKLMASGENNPAADLDGSGSVGVGDIEEILKIMAGA
jgi:hypothetical protein